MKNSAAFRATLPALAASLATIASANGFVVGTQAGIGPIAAGPGQSSTLGAFAATLGSPSISILSARSPFGPIGTGPISTPGISIMSSQRPDAPTGSRPLSTPNETTLVSATFTPAITRPPSFVGTPGEFDTMTVSGGVTIPLSERSFPYFQAGIPIWQTGSNAVGPTQTLAIHAMPEPEPVAMFALGTAAVVLRGRRKGRAAR